MPQVLVCGCVFAPDGNSYCDEHLKSREGIEARIAEMEAMKKVREPVRDQMIRKEAWNQHDSHREHILWQARKAITDTRQEQYGSALDNLNRIAQFWNTYLGNDIKVELEADDVAVMMTLLKVARIVANNKHRDNYIDACGYLALASEVVHDINDGVQYYEMGPE